MSSTKTGIEWCDRTWNPIVGCTRVSKGCEHCYAERMAKRLEAMGVKHYQGLLDHNGRWNGKVALAEHKLNEPLGWKKPQTVFVNSMGDLFHENVPDEWIDRVLVAIAKCRQHTFIVLTKRADRMLKYFTSVSDGTSRERLFTMSHYTTECHEWHMGYRRGKPIENLAIGVSVEDQRTADERIPLLLQTPARWRFVSYEPALAPVDFSSFVKAGYWYCAECDEEVSSKFVTHKEAHESCGCYCVWTPLLHGIIMGGESGPLARSMTPEWVRRTWDECHVAGVNFFFKQWGDNPDDSAFEEPYGLVCASMQGKHCGRLLDGREHNDLPWEDK